MASRPWVFSVTCEPAAGETVCVVGSAPQLGGWSLESAVELQRADTQLNGANGDNGANGANGDNGTDSTNGTNATSNGISENEA